MENELEQFYENEIKGLSSASRRKAYKVIRDEAICIDLGNNKGLVIDLRCLDGHENVSMWCYSAEAGKHKTGGSIFSLRLGSANLLHIGCEEIYDGAPYTP